MTKFFLLIVLGLVSHTLNGLDRSTETWKLVHEEDGIKIFKGQEGRQGSLPFKAETIIDAPISLLIMAIFDYERKPEWAPKLMKVTMIRKVSKSEFIFKERYQTPWPALHRLFNLTGSVHSPDKGKFIFTAQSIKDRTLDDSCCVTSDVKLIELIFEDKGLNKTSVNFTFQGHFGGWIPTWLSNLILKKWPFKFLKGLELQALKKDLIPTSDYLEIEQLYPWLESDRKSVSVIPMQRKL